MSRTSSRLALLTGMLLAIAGTAGLARDISPETLQAMQPPRLAAVEVDWAAALSMLTVAAEPRVTALASDARQNLPPVLARLNAATSRRFPGVAESPVPVLLPLDADAPPRDAAADTTTDATLRHPLGLQSSAFFFAGPSGYDAVFSVRTDEVPEFSNIKFHEPIDVLISGSLLLYELDDPTPAQATPVPALEVDFPGIRRLFHEHHLRYTFVRFGVPYVISTACVDAGVSRSRMPPCRVADRVLTHVLQALGIAGGTPQARRPVQPSTIERPAEMSATFRYHGPGRLLPGTGFRGHGGRADSTVYSQIRFPLAQAPAFANSQVFHSRNRPLATDRYKAPNYSYPWRDNFCERRGLQVGQCPGGAGHQGQDIRPALCPQGPKGEGCSAGRDLVAVRDGAILRRPRQEAVYLFVNTANEHIRFRYLHMLPSKMDEDNLLNGRRVHEGEVIAQIGNFSRRAGGTSYHLHFDVQVPTAEGWVFVNPYMTLVAAYERLIGERGARLLDPPAFAMVYTSTTGATLAAPASIIRHNHPPRIDRTGATIAAPASIIREIAQRPSLGKRASKKHNRYAQPNKRKKTRLARR